MSSFLSDFKRAFVQEARTTADTPLLWLTGIVVPVFWCLAVVAVFATGLMRNIPVGLVDYDNSAESRDLIRSLDAVASVDFINYENPQAATADLATGNIYALFVIGHNWSEKTSGSRSDSALELFLNKSYYAIATTVETDLKLALSQIQVGQMLEAASVVGGGFAGNKERLAVLDADILIAGNPALNFKAYLLTTILPGVLALGAILTCVGSLTREWRLKTVHQVVGTYSHLTGFLLGRMIFWLVLYSLMGLAYLAWFTGWEGWGVQGSLVAWALGIVLFFASMPALAMLYTSLSPSWIIAMSVAIGTTAPIFPFTGFSFPLDSMDSVAQLLAQFLPLTWYLRLHSSQWVLGSDLSHTIHLLSMLSLFVIIPAAVGLALLPMRMRKWAQKELKPHSVVDLPEPIGFWETVRTVLARGAFTKDTFVIFVIAVAFYLLFYAWPYAAQNVTSVQTAVVDLDRSAASMALNLVRAGAPLETLKKLQMAPVAFADVNLYNPLSGYASYIVAAVMPVIIQAVMFVSIVMSLGGWLASSQPPSVLRAVCRNTRGFAALYTAFWLFSLVWLAYALGPDFVLFDFASMQNPGATLLMASIFGAAVVSFGLAFTFAMGTNAYGAQFFVVISAPALFLSGVVHPLFDMTPPALALRLFLPSTSGINGLVAVSQNAAPLYAVMPQLAHLLVLAVAYGVLAFVLWKRAAKKIQTAELRS